MKKFALLRMLHVLVALAVLSCLSLPVFAQRGGHGGGGGGGFHGGSVGGGFHGGGGYSGYGGRGFYGGYRGGGNYGWRGGYYGWRGGYWGYGGYGYGDGASDFWIWVAHIGGDTRMRTATAPGGSLPIPTIIRMLVLRAIHVLTMETTIRRRQRQIQNPRATLRNPRDLPCRTGLPTRTMTPMPWWLLRRVLRCSQLTG